MKLQGYNPVTKTNWISGQHVRLSTMRKSDVSAWRTSNWVERARRAQAFAAGVKRMRTCARGYGEKMNAAGEEKSSAPGWDCLGSDGRLEAIVSA
jgi:hypothetical protein